jgi:hypothetical protein
MAEKKVDASKGQKAKIEKAKASRQNKLTDTMPLLVAMRNSSRHETWLA